MDEVVSLVRSKARYTLIAKIGVLTRKYFGYLVGLPDESFPRTRRVIERIDEGESEIIPSSEGEPR